MNNIKFIIFIFNGKQYSLYNNFFISLNYYYKKNIFSRKVLFILCNRRVFIGTSIISGILLYLNYINNTAICNSTIKFKRRKRYLKYGTYTNYSFNYVLNKVFIIKYGKKEIS